MPSGTTPRSKEILAKRAHRKFVVYILTKKYLFLHILIFKSSVYSDKPEKKGIFDRLELETNGQHSYETVDLLSTEPRIKVTGLDKPASSVFSRLGGMKNSQRLEDDDVVLLSSSQSFSGILKRHAAKVQFVIHL